MLEEKHKKALSALINQELDSDKSFCFSVGTDSMAPVIRPGDKISVRRVGGDSIRRGDIVVYQMHQELFTHRVLGWNSQRQFITKGDRALIIDEPVGQEERLGKVVARERAGGVVNFESKSWKIANSFLGALSYLQWIVFRFLRGCKRRIVGFPRVS